MRGAICTGKKYISAGLGMRTLSHGYYLLPVRIAQALPMYKGQDWNLYWWILTEEAELKGSNLSYALSYAKFILLFLICLEWRNKYFYFPFYISDNEAANSRILGLALVANAYFWTKESESKKYAPGEARTHNPGIALHCL